MSSDGGTRAVSTRAVTGRQLRAAATRQRMMAAACSVFSIQGYAKATMDEIAREASVAVQTLYFTFGTKAKLLQAAYDFAVLGPDPVPPHLSDWWRAADAEPRLTPAVQLIVQGTLKVFARAAPLVWAVHSDPDAADAYRYNEDLRASGYLLLVDLLAEKAPLSAGLDTRRARDIMLTLLSPATYMLLTAEGSWTATEYGQWVTGAITRELFGAEIDAGG